jgi:hypothetical protein
MPNIGPTLDPSENPPVGGDENGTGSPFPGDDCPLVGNNVVVLVGRVTVLVSMDVIDGDVVIAGPPEIEIVVS